MPIDLSGKKPPAKKEEGDTAKPKRTRKPYEGPSGTQRMKIAEIRTKTKEVTARFADLIENRDPELATILREDGPAMADCLGDLAKGFAFLRKPLLLVLSVVEPIRAFGRIVRLLTSRLADWQARRAEAWEREQAEREAAAAAAAGDGGTP